jgi:hypothetical protein
MSPAGVLFALSLLCLGMSVEIVFDAKRVHSEVWELIGTFLASWAVMLLIVTGSMLLEGRENVR